MEELLSELIVSSGYLDFKSEGFQECPHGERDLIIKRWIKNSRTPFVPLNQPAESFAADDVIEYGSVVLRLWIDTRRGSRADRNESSC